MAGREEAGLRQLSTKRYVPVFSFVQEITFLPQASKTLSEEDLGSFEKLLGMLNDCDDVQEIYHNVALPG